MKDLNHQLRTLCRRNRDGSFGTQDGRWHMLDLMATQLHELGYRKMRATSLKPKHVNALVARWREQGISTGTLKNRLSVLRWWAGKVNKSSVVAKGNDAYGIGTRMLVSNKSKAQTLDKAKLAKIDDEYVRLSVRLQAAFGLRREEAIKFSPSYAFRGDHIALKPSWTKGGRPRTVPITNHHQQRLLRDVAELAKGGSLIPAHLNYVQQQRRYDRQIRKAGMRNLHGLRHAYAQRRYRQLTGWNCPARGGPASQDLSPEQRAIDEEARLTISHELGHSRAAITAVYTGK
ncbi:MAG: phage integrase N-terminal domain-containing protein [Woeseiaceae bacterium]